MKDIEKFKLTDEDFCAIYIAEKTGRRLLKHSQIKPQQIVGIDNALYAIERLPKVTKGVNCEFGIEYRDGTKDHKEMRCIIFRITDYEFEISIGGSVYDKLVGNDSFSEPGWFIDIEGYRDTKCELFYLEDTIEEYLKQGAIITVEDESDIEYE